MGFAYMQLYRPTRTSDNKGGWTDSYASAKAFWGATRIHQGAVILTCGAGADIRPEDVIDTGLNAYYRVTDIVGNPQAPYREAILERTERPISK